MVKIQHWINNVFHITDVQSAPIIITLLVFITGGILSSIYSLINSIAIRREIRRQFYLLSEELAGNALIQGENYVETTKGFTLDGLNPLTMRILDIYQPGIFKEVGYVKVFESIFVGLENWFFFRLISRKRKLEAFHSCWKAMSGILFWQERANNDLKFVQEYYNTHNEKRNDGMLQFERLTYDIYGSLMGNPQDEYAKKYLKELLQIKAEWSKMKNSVTPNIAYEYLVKPVLEISMNNIFDGAQMVRFCLMEVEAEYNNMDRMMSVYKEQFLKYSAIMEKYANDLVIGRYTIKSFCVMSRESE